MLELIKIQAELKAPKNQYNAFGKYSYRTCEDILEALKPLLVKHECTLTIQDDIKEICGIPYVEATVTIQKNDEGISVTAQAGINPDRKGMDIAQSFGSSSSYARKYALNGLFLIDDTKDADEDPRKWLNKGDQLNRAIAYLKASQDQKEALERLEATEKTYRLSLEIKTVLTNVINQL